MSSFLTDVTFTTMALAIIGGVVLLMVAYQLLLNSAEKIFANRRKNWDRSSRQSTHTLTMHEQVQGVLHRPGRSNLS
jgi:hypothetical protein